MMKMSGKKLLSILIVLVVLVALSTSGAMVGATRVLPEDFAKANHLELEAFPSPYEKAKCTMAFWLERLASGPSPKGPGH